MSYLAQEGATAFELKVQGGHKDIKSVERIRNPLVLLVWQGSSVG